MDSSNITTSSPPELPGHVLDWAILSKGAAGLVSWLLGWLCAAVLLTGFLLAQSQKQSAFKELSDKAGNKIPHGPTPLPIVGKAFCPRNIIV
jgi:hypothetical protein